MKRRRSSGTFLCSIICCILAVIITLSGIDMLLSSYLKITIGDSTVSTFIGYNDKNSKSFEESVVFDTAFKNATENVARMCVIKEQLETNGKYDAGKKIDVNAYANRISPILKDDLSAVYKLDDLIKWGNNGYDFQVISGSKNELDECFEELKAGKDITTNRIRTIHVDEINEPEYLGDYVEAQMEEFADKENGYYKMYVLVDRYKTVDGKRLAECANTRTDYDTLVRNLIESTNSLSYNYSEYSSYDSTYNLKSTNVLYCVQTADFNGNTRRYTNLSTDVANISGDALYQEFSKHNKFVYFNPDKMSLKSTVSSIDATYMKQVLNEYSYTYGDGSRIWIAIDESYPANDIFKVAKEAYNSRNSNFVPASVTLVAALLFFILFIIIMTIIAGREIVVDEEGKKKTVISPTKIDHIPIEVWLVMFIIALGFAALLTGYTIKYLVMDYDLLLANRVMFSSVLAIEAVILCAVFIPLYLILVRKIKNKLIWNSSICNWIVRKMAEGILDLYDNGQVSVRTWLPYLLFLFANLIMVLLGNIYIFIAFVADMVVGVFLYKEAKTRAEIVDGISVISSGDVKHTINSKGLHGDNLALAEAVNNIGEEIRKAVDTSMRDEKMKADLITNVSHDIKTPLTSIINYVDLLKRENIEDEKIQGYIDVLDKKSQRLKALTNDLVEASKISSGNISLNIEKINLVELVNQSIGEFSEKFDEKGLRIVLSKPELPVFIMADSRGVYRVVENLYNNVYKYALENTRVYVDVNSDENRAVLSIKNISAAELNVTGDELTERFIRGDSSRKTEGSGLGLSIAKSLTEAMNGSFEIMPDGDLFKAIVSFDMCE